MKKLVLFFSVCAAMGLASCGCNTSCDNAAANADSTEAVAVEDTTVAADSTASDSTVAGDSTVAVADSAAKAE